MFSMDHVLQDLAPQRKTPSWQLNLLKQLFREKEFQQLAENNRHLKGVDMVEQILDYFQIRCELSDRCLEQIPSYGPVVIVANHPIGTLEGLALLSAVASVRADVKVVANRLLSQIESFSSLMIPVDNMGGNRTGRAQISMMQEHPVPGG
jgi:putative hemolysin